MKKSRILSAFLALVLCIGIFPLQTVAAEAPASDFEYWEDYDGIIIEDYIGSSKSVVIPSKIDGMNVVSIESEAFYGTGVTSITIPVTLKYIKYGDGGSYFSCNTLQSVTVNAANTAFSSVNGVLFNKVKTCLYQYPSMKSGSSYTVPNTVTKIGSFAFYRVPNLVSITLPSSLKAIDWLAISSCTKLKSLAIPDQVKSLDYATIGTCPALTSVSIGSGATYIDANAFYDCASLSAININSANKNYSSSSGVLFNKAKTSLIKYPVKKAGTSYSIPSSVNYILYGAFKDCSALNLSFPNKKLNIARNALHDTKWFSGQQNGVVYAAKNAYSYKGTMPKDYALTLKSDTVYVTEGAFSRQGNLKSVVIPDSVTGLADEAFYNSYRLSSVKLGKSVANIGNSTFANTAITGLAIPASVRTIGDYAFGSCEQLKTLTIAPGVTSIGEAAFVNSGLTSVKLPYTLTEIKMETFNSYDDTLKSVTIPATVTSISYFAFPSVKNLTINGYKNTPAETFA